MNADQYDPPQAAKDAYTSGEIPGHTHPGGLGGVEPGPDPDDGRAAALHGVAYMISPVGAFRITRGSNGYAITKLTKGGWGADKADIVGLIINWNRFAGKSTATGVTGKGGKGCTQVY